jgi:hypothetical protein
MNQFIAGSMISGEADPDAHEFTVTEIKSIPTHSVWDTQQVQEVYELLTRVINSGQDSLIISTGMLPLLLNRTEIEKLQSELRSILTFIR